MATGMRAPQSWSNFGQGWGSGGQQGYSLDSPTLSGGFGLNAMDLASDGYHNSGIPNVGGLSYGQGVGGASSVTAGGSRSFMDSMMGGKNQDGSSFNGWGGAAIGAAGSIFNAYMGMKQYGLAKEQFAFNKDMTTRNFNAQANLTNSHLADRQSARRAAGENVQDVSGYMGQYGVKKV